MFVVLFALQTSGAALSAEARPAAEPPGPPGSPPAKKVNGCPPNSGHASGGDLDDPSPDSQVWFCGTPGSDRMHSEVGHDIYAKQGADTIYADNNHVDEIWGGGEKGQTDRALIDPKLDRVKPDVELCATRAAPRKWQSCKKLQPSQRRLARSSDLVYPYIGPAVECTYQLDGQRFIRFTGEPTMRAPDVTTLPDFQTVAWRPLLYRWDGTDWKFLAWGQQWLWDRTRDQQFDQTEGFTGNFWRRFDNNKRWFLWFNPTEPGIYRVAIRYHWYAEKNPTIPEHDDLQWARIHFGVAEDPTHPHAACSYPS